MYEIHQLCENSFHELERIILSGDKYAPPRNKIQFGLNRILRAIWNPIKFMRLGFQIFFKPWINWAIISVIGFIFLLFILNEYFLLALDLPLEIWPRRDIALLVIYSVAAIIALLSMPSSYSASYLKEDDFHRGNIILESFITLADLAYFEELVENTKHSIKGKLAGIYGAGAFIVSFAYFGLRLENVSVTDMIFLWSSLGFALVLAFLAKLYSLASYKLIAFTCFLIAQKKHEIRSSAEL